MQIVFTDQALEEYRHHERYDSKKALRIKALVEDIVAHPFSGIGKPEPLRHQLSGLWSRRISREDRLVYSVEGDMVTVYQCRYHYQRR